MSTTSFENYAKIAEKSNLSHTEVAGRYEFQQNAERKIIIDVIEKLEIDSNNSLIEIGCGPGNLLIPLSYLVREAHGIDNSEAIKRMEERIKGDKRIVSYSGNFFEVDFGKLVFDKILIYSVMQYLSNIEEAKKFLSKALKLLAPGGRLLLGDLPNKDKKTRWMSTQRAKEIQKEWSRKIAENGKHPLEGEATDTQMSIIDDSAIYELVKYGRELGFESYIMPQNAGLPFSNTREDVMYVSKNI